MPCLQVGGGGPHMETEGGEGTAGCCKGKVAARLMKHETVTVGVGGLYKKLACAPDKN